MELNKNKIWTLDISGKETKVNLNERCFNMKKYDDHLKLGKRASGIVIRLIYYNDTLIKNVHIGV